MKQKKLTISDTVRNPKFRINPALDEYAGKVLFPKKLAKANEMLRGVKLPKVGK